MLIVATQLGQLSRYPTPDHDRAEASALRWAIGELESKSGPSESSTNPLAPGHRCPTAWVDQLRIREP